MENLQFTGECGFHLGHNFDQKTISVRMLEVLDTIEENGWRESLWIIDKRFGISGSRQTSSGWKTSNVNNLNWKWL